MMKICHVCSYFDNVLFSKLIEAQMRMGVENRVFYFRAKGKKAPNAEKSDVDLSYSYYPWQRAIFHWKHKSVLKDFKRRYTKNSFDLLFAHSLFSNGYIAYSIKKQWEIPYIVMVQNTDINVFFKRIFWLRGLGHKILENAEYVITASETYKEELLRKYVPKKMYDSIKEKIVVIPYGIDNLFFEETVIQRKKEKKEMNILTVGTICKNKNQLVVCKALNQMQKQGYKIKYTIIGASWNDNILKKIKAYNFVEYIPFITQKNLIQYYQAADIFVLLSKTETFGLVYAEAISQGVPIIYTKGQGFDKQFEEGLVGYHVEYNNIDCLIKKIKYIYKNVDNYKAKCQAASKKFLWSNITKQYIKIYKEILSKG